MGARQSKRSVDITTTPKKDGATPSDGSVAGDAAAPGDGKLERIEETDGKPTTNGTANNHPDSSNNDEKDIKDKEQEKGKDKDKDKDEDTEKDHDNRAEDTTKSESKTEAVVLAEEATTPTEAQSPTSPDATTSPESKDTKKKEKKKWSFRSLSFGKRDRSKTTREGGTPKNGDVAKTEPLAEGGEEAEAVLQSVDETPVENKPEVVVDEVAVSPSAVAVTSASSTVESESSPVVPDEIATAASEESTAAVAEAAAAAAAVSPLPIKEKEALPTSPPPPIPASNDDASSLNVKNENIVANKPESNIEEQTEAKEKINENEDTDKEKEKEKETATATANVVAQQQDGENKEEEAPATSVESVVEQHQTVTVKTLEEGEGTTTTTTTTKGVILLDNTEVSQSNLRLETPSSTTSQAQAQANVDNTSANVQADYEVEVKSSPPSIVERKTSEELPTPPPLPSSPPPTPIEPSPLEHAAASPSALAEALKLPAEAAANDILKLEDKNNFKATSNDDFLSVDDSSKIIMAVEKGYENLKENQKQKNIVDPDNISSYSNSFSLSSSSSSSCQLPSTVYSFSRDVVKEDKEEDDGDNDCQVVGEKKTNFDGEEERKIVNEDKEDGENINNFVNDTEIENQTTKVINDVFTSDLISQQELNSHIEDRDNENENENEKEGDSVIVEAKPALVVNEDNNIEASKFIEKLKEEEEKERRDDDVDDKNEKVKEEEEEEEIVPPLPESPIPNFDKTDFTKELDSEAVFDPIEELRASHLAAEGNTGGAVFRDVGSTVFNSSSPPQLSSSSSSSSFIIEEKKASEVIEEKDDDFLALRKNEIYTDDFESIPKINDKIMKTESEIVFTTTNGDRESNCEIIKSNLNDILDIDNFVKESKNSNELLLEFDKKISLNGSSDDFDKKIESLSSFSSVINKKEDRESSSNEEFEVESISQSLHSYKDSDDILKDRLINNSDEKLNGKNNYDEDKNDGDNDDDTAATATTTNCSLTLIEFSNTTLSDNNTSTTNDLLLQDNYHDHQKIAEPESATVENEAEISTTESLTETPASLAPPAPIVELPILPPSEPAITEDVASVTKAIEEIDISDKAVAAAVNEAIESVNANEIVNDSLHQNIIKE